MDTVIECCMRNVDGGDRERLRETGGETTVRISPCLEHCGMCRRESFLVVDGELVTGAERDRALPDEKQPRARGEPR